MNRRPAFGRVDAREAIIGDQSRRAIAGPRRTAHFSLSKRSWSRAWGASSPVRRPVVPTRLRVSLHLLERARRSIFSLICCSRAISRCFLASPILGVLDARAERCLVASAQKLGWPTRSRTAARLVARHVAGARGGRLWFGLQLVERSDFARGFGGDAHPLAAEPLAVRASA